MSVFLLLICGVLVLSAVIKLCLAVYAPKAYEALVADEERRRQRRNAALKTGLGLATKFLHK